MSPSKDQVPARDRAEPGPVRSTASNMSAANRTGRSRRTPDRPGPCSAEASTHPPSSGAPKDRRQIANKPSTVQAAPSTIQGHGQKRMAQVVARVRPVAVDIGAEDIVPEQKVIVPPGKLKEVSRCRCAGSRRGTDREIASGATPASSQSRRRSGLQTRWPATWLGLRSRVPFCLSLAARARMVSSLRRLVNGGTRLGTSPTVDKAFPRFIS